MNEYRQRALNRTNSGNVANTTNKYRQRALNRQQKIEEPKVEEIKIEPQPQPQTQTSFKPVNAREFITNKFIPVDEIEKKVYTLPDGSVANKNDYTAEEQQKLLSGEYVINPNYNPSEYMSQKILYKGQIKDSNQVEQERWDNANALEKAKIVAGKTANTVKNIGESAILGSIQAAEGIADTGLTVAANVANLAGAKDTADYITNMIKIDSSGDALKKLDSSTNLGYGRYNPSILGVDLSDISREGARMLTAGKAGGLRGFVTSAIGGNVKESLNEGQSLGRASIYGGLTGTAEGAFEKLFDTFNLLGGGVLDKFISKNVFARLATTPLGEYVEEWLSQGINPFIKMATYDKNANIKNPFASWENVKEWLHNNNEAGWQSYVMGLVLQSGSDISNSQARKQYKNEVSKAVNKIKGLTQQQKQETISELVKGAEKSNVQIEKIMQNYKQNSQYDKYIPQVQEQNIKLPTSQENVAPELPTMASQQAMLPTNQTEGKTAQNGNIEQIAKNIENNNILEYNNNRGVENGREQEIIEGRNQGNLEETKNERSNKTNSERNSDINESKIRIAEEARRQPIEPQTESEKQIAQKAKQLGIKFNLYENGNDNFDGFSTQDGVFIDRNSKQDGKVVFSHELLHNLRQNNNSTFNEEIKPLMQDFGESTEFINTFNKFNETLQEEIPVNQLAEAKELILEEIFADYTAKVLSNYDIDYGINIDTYNKLQNSLLKITQPFEVAFSMPKNYIDPTQDIQKATEFVSKATVEDIDALNKMIEEAEKYPDRIDLQFFAEKARARLEKISREQVENMVEEGIKQNKISYSDSIYRNLRRALGEKGYQYAKENILDKLDAAKLDNVNMKIEIANELKSYVVDELGIKKGSKESELVQKYGEKEITLDELKEATPNWENVVKADKWFRSKYDQLIDMINESRTEIYPYIEEKIEATELELEVVKQQIKDIEENGTPNYKKDAEIRTRIENIKKRIDAKDEKLESIKNKDTMAYKNNLRIKNEAVESLNDLNDLLDVRAENKLYKLNEKAKKLQKTLDSEELWRGKRIPKRKDYYRHFQEMTEGFEALGNILATPAEISSGLSGISENTKPNAKWLGLAQRRLGNKTKYDAVGGFLNYLDSASYAINIDPEIKRIRDFTEEIRNASGDNTTANRLIEYLTDYANDLAGKTNPMDRYLQKIIPGGRKTMKAISWLTNRIKSNAVLGNFNSAAAQILNLPQGLADIKNPKNIGIGFWETLTGKDSRYKDSQFIIERFESDVYSQFDEKLIDQPKKFATWLLGALDEFGTKTIWNGEYSKAIDMGIKDPVRYADYRTRDLVAGRGIGELSLNQRSKTIGLLAPFTVEVSNYWGVVKDFISAKDFGGLILLQVFGHLFNEGLEELGISAGVFDLIDALIDAWNTEGGIDKKAGRVAGEFLSNTMFGQQLASLYPENGADLGVYKLPTRSELFGDADPTRMGTGSVLSKAISNPITSVALPWGGTQLNKTTQGLSTFAKGGSYSKDAEGKDKLKYPVEQNASNLVKSALFGKWSTPGARDYIDRGFKPLSANQTEAYNKAMKAGISSDDFYKVYDATRGIESDKDRNGKTIENSKSKKLKEAIDKATPKLSSSQRKILYDAFNVSKTVQGGNGLPTASDFKVNLPKANIKVEK